MQQRRLAGSVGAEQREQLLVANRKAYLVECEGAAIALGEGVDTDRVS